MEHSRHSPTILFSPTILPFLCYFPKVIVTSSYFDYYEDAYKNILSQAVFSKNHTANFIDSSNFCYSKNNTAYSSGPIPEYRWFWCIYFRYLEQCRKKAVLVFTHFRISSPSRNVCFWKISFWYYADLEYTKFCWVNF